MKEGVWGYWIIILGISVLTIMMLFQDYSTTNQQDYYLIKEVAQASMIDAVDYGYYEKYGELKINKEKFIENFIRRFAENVSLNKKYSVNFYSIYETPPAVSIEVKAITNEYLVMNNGMNSDITTRITAILEQKDLN